MKKNSRTVCSVFAALALSALVRADLPVTFNLQVDQAGVALQFDVTSDSPLESIGMPKFEGATDHNVRSATIESGAHRFVVYSQSGTPIAASGEVSVTFNPSLLPGDGVISLINITASDAEGAVVSASPNALPVLTQEMRTHQSLELGDSIAMEAVVYDLDGSVTSVQLFNGNDEVDSSDTDPFAIAWTPDSTGAFSLSLVATDNLSQQSIFDLGVHRAFTDNEIVDYDSFASIHFGSTPADTAFDADPLDNGLENGMAYLLGLNPYSPNYDRLPRSRIEKTGDDTVLVLSFIRRSNATGVDWDARKASNLVDFEALDSPQIIENDRQDGTHLVELRIPLEPESEESTFIELEVNQS
ncbi:Ig-like domain-containing protein [Pelagicoccus mobilis]|uniref:Cohesin domain-containing protein n=1 Tax=Pelagicoccus mobilis TaxID=415221 RepID=A0A934RV57_9BACT|nr:hypothetical protein [Pelagicoccus mobilis]MBK1877031.1 hypothetical protein [Pelagicoccus mobilis]